MKKMKRFLGKNKKNKRPEKIILDGDFVEAELEDRKNLPQIIKHLSIVRRRFSNKFAN